MLDVERLHAPATHWWAHDIGGRTVQMLPGEAQIIGQIGAQRITLKKRIMFIIFLP